MTLRVWTISFALALGSASPSAPSGGAPLATELAQVIAQRLDKTVSLPSDLIAFQSVAIYAKVSGFIQSIDVDRGSWVKKDQALAVLLAPELQARTVEAEARVQAAASQVAEAEARMFAAESTHDRLKAAAATPGVVAGHDLELAEKSLEAAKANRDAAGNGLKAAQAGFDAVQEMEAYLELRAPFAGVVTERNSHPGSLVGPSGPPVIKIEQVSKLRLVVPVPEIYVGGIARGARVRFKVAAYPDQTFEGVVQRPAHSLDVETRSMLVELDVENPKQVLAPGMFADVEWPVSRGETTLFVPTSAVVRTSERQFVVRVRDGVAEWVDVRRGQVQGELIEVFGHLQEGETVVRRGTDEIRPGSKITANAAKR
jgi:RND family efflux transporter MFP subunit